MEYFLQYRSMASPRLDLSTAIGYTMVHGIIGMINFALAIFSFRRVYRADLVPDCTPVTRRRADLVR
jgi:hypothetical protein